MNYITVSIKPNYSVYVQEDRNIEFLQNYFLDSAKDARAKGQYLYEAIMAGWVKREPQA